MGIEQASSGPEGHISTDICDAIRQKLLTRMHPQLNFVAINPML